VSEELVQDPVFGLRYRFRRRQRAEGDVLEVEMWVDPGGGVTPHVHPAMEERFEVLAGRPSFLAGRDWSTLGSGEQAIVAPGVRHAFRNRADEVAHIVCRATPPSTLEEFLRDAAGLSRSGSLTRHALPSSPRALLQAAVMAHHYRDMVTLLFPPMPPPLVQRLVFPALARLGERRGLRAGSFAELG